MEKPSIDPNMLPEPLRSMMQNIDPALIEQLRNSIDPATLMNLLGGATDMLRQSLSAQDAEALQQLLGNVMQLFNNQGK